MESKKLFRISRAAALCGVKRTTLQSAVERGELPVHPTGCGLPLVTLADVRKWAPKKRPPGRKPKPKE